VFNSVFFFFIVVCKLLQNNHSASSEEKQINHYILQHGGIILQLRDAKIFASFQFLQVIIRLKRGLVESGGVIVVVVVVMVVVVMMVMVNMVSRVLVILLVIIISIDWLIAVEVDSFRMEADGLAAGFGRGGEAGMAVQVGRDPADGGAVAEAAKVEHLLHHQTRPEGTMRAIRAIPHPAVRVHLLVQLLSLPLLPLTQQHRQSPHHTQPSSVR